MHTDPTQHSTKDKSSRISADSPAKKLVCQVRLWPGVRTRAFLGEYDESQLKGFLVELTPDPAAVNMLAVQIIKYPAGPKKKLLLQAANDSQEVITARIWEL